MVKKYFKGKFKNCFCCGDKSLAVADAWICEYMEDVPEPTVKDIPEPPVKEVPESTVDYFHTF